MIIRAGVVITVEIENSETKRQILNTDQGRGELFKMIIATDEDVLLVPAENASLRDKLEILATIKLALKRRAQDDKTG